VRAEPKDEKSRPESCYRHEQSLESIQLDRGQVMSLHRVATLTFAEQITSDAGMQQLSGHPRLVKRGMGELQRYPISSTPPSRVPPPLASLPNA